jgi:putative nucleotidyltransferase with HDIG domain
MEAVQKRSGLWFDPELVKAAASLAGNGTLWKELESRELLQKVALLEPEYRRVTATDEAIDRICIAFADVIDAKSPFTYRHSNGVAEAAVEIGEYLGMNPRSVKMLRRAALLHDIGKLSVPNAILEKPGKLTGAERVIVKAHPYYTLEVLKKIPGFERLSEDAAAHHEKLDGSGYWRGLRAEQLSRYARILAVADIFDALHSKRPYRDGLPLDQVFQILRKDAPHALDLPCVEALIAAKTKSEPEVFARQESEVTV